MRRLAREFPVYDALYEFCPSRSVIASIQSLLKNAPPVSIRQARPSPAKGAEARWQLPPGQSFPQLHNRLRYPAEQQKAEIKKTSHESDHAGVFYPTS